MSRILGIDYGIKRCGLAVTDPMQLIVSGLDTIFTNDLKDFVLAYNTTENLHKIVLGKPVHKDGTDTFLMLEIEKFSEWVLQMLPNVQIDFVDERNTSVAAKAAILESGVKKKDRRNKALVDKVSAVIILQRYLGHY
ncbi:MAG: Holliday junction resolvase RuvX [Saprospiraceae bacterium]|nr:Holliday junction resolvase RuvX [Saprospiraceae bacterium]